MTTNTNILLYGSVIKFRSTEPKYNSKFFFVERLDDDELVVKDNKGNKISIQIEDEQLPDSITEIIILYKPTLTFAELHRLYPSVWVEVEIDDITVQGQIVKVDRYLEIKLRDRHIYIPIDRGFPKNIISITPIPTPGLKQRLGQEVLVGEGDLLENEDEEGKRKTKGEGKTKGEEEETKEYEENVILGFIEEEIDTGGTRYFYSTEQQTTDLLEHLLFNVPEEERTPKKIKQITKIIKRYKELRTKYTTFTNGIYVNKLPINQILSNAYEMKNTFLIPLTKNIKINRYIDEDEMDEIEIDSEYYENNISDWYKAPIEKLKPQNETKYEEKVLATEDIIRNKIVNLNKKSNELLDVIDQMKEIYLYDKITLLMRFNRYKLRLNESYIVNSIIIPPIDCINYSKVYQSSTCLIDKSNLSRHPFYSYFYKFTKELVTEESETELFMKDSYVYYINKCDIFEKYLKNILPNLNDWVESGINKGFINPFYNYYQAIKQLETIQLNELHSADYHILESFIKLAVTRYKKNMQHTEIEERVLQETIPSEITKSYNRILASIIKNDYYSSSEILKLTEIDNLNYYKELYIQRLPMIDIDDTEIKELIIEIRQRINQEDGKKIDKYYTTEQEKENDNGKTVLKNIDKIPAIEYIYKSLKDSRLSLEELGRIIKQLIDNGMKIPKALSKLTNIELIIRMLINLKIIEGNLAFVKESEKMYTWNGREWIDLLKDACFNENSLVVTKGDCNKDDDYNKRVLSLINELNERKIRERTTEATNQEFKVAYTEQLLLSLNRKKIKLDTQYNEEKVIYYELEVQSEKIKILDSPYFELRDKILAEQVLENKYKLIQLFVQKYTKKGIDLNWFYCVQTSVKLIPSFFNKLANAYLITNNYDDVMAEICLTQGTKSDNGDKWVDKHSGYVIDNIEFDDDEGFDVKGFKRTTRDVIDSSEKNIFDKDVIEEITNEMIINTTIKTLFYYLGVVYIEPNGLYDLITQSHKLAIEAGLKENPKKPIGLLCIIIGHILVYIQTFDGSLKMTSSFPNCKKSFKGFPLDENGNIDGIKYIACVVKSLSKGGTPWDVFNKIEEDAIVKMVGGIISKYILVIYEIEEKIKLKRLELPKEEVTEYISTVWERFYPRLTPIKQLVEREQRMLTVEDCKDRITYLSFLIQKEINDHVSKEDAILTDHLSKPFLVNACCNTDNYVYRYFLNRTRIEDKLIEIISLKKKLRKVDKLLVVPRLYFKEKQAQIKLMPSTEFSEETRYSGIIKWVQTNPDIIGKIIKDFPRYDAADSLKIKIEKMKDQGIEINEETFLNLLKKVAVIIPDDAIKPEILLPDDEVVTLLDSKNNKQILDTLYKSNSEMISYIEKTYPPLLPVINFNKECLKEKRNMLISVTTEHYNYLNQILYNKIKALLFIFPQFIFSNKEQHKVSCEHWKLSPEHSEDITNMVMAYYANMLRLTKDESLAATLKKVSLTRYKMLFTIEIPDQKVKNMFYQYILISIFNSYFKEIKSSTDKSNIRKYIDAIIALFVKEDKYALNFDITKINYEVKLSKKSETEIKTDYLKSLSQDARKSENVLKEHKLEKWGAGLQKGMFKYVKGNYLKDKTDAQAIIDNLEKDTPDKLDVYSEEAGEFAPLDDPDEYSSLVSESYEEDDDNENEEE